MSAAAREASERATASDGILKTVSRIADQSHILSLNGGIEAARAGLAGRAFAAVVEEMGQLSKDTGAAVSSVQIAVDAIREAIGSVNTAIRESSGVSDESVRTMEEIAPMMTELRDMIAKLEAAFRNLMD
jgi:methyl-accepting chemotaxis protein